MAAILPKLNNIIIAVYFIKAFTKLCMIDFQIYSRGQVCHIYDRNILIHNQACSMQHLSKYVSYQMFEFTTGVSWCITSFDKKQGPVSI